jgi:putative membrane protein
MTSSQVLAFHLHPEVWALAAAIVGAYFLALKRWAPAGAPGATKGQIASFCLGAFVLLVASTWPIHDIAERSLYSVHMSQHLLLTLVMVPLFLAGTPAWLFRKLVRPRPVWVVVKNLSRPVPAIIVFNAVLVFTHWPLVVNAVVAHHAIHFWIHLLMVISAFFMWMPVLSPILEIPRLSYPGQMIYLFVQSLVPTVPASFLTFGDKPLYAAYVHLPKLGGISPLTDQLIAGLIMKLFGAFVLWGFVGVLFFKWYSVEKSEGVDVLKWRDVDRELNRAELTKQ